MDKKLEELKRKLDLLIFMNEMSKRNEEEKLSPEEFANLVYEEGKKRGLLEDLVDNILETIFEMVQSPNPETKEKGVEATSALLKALSSRS